MRAMVIRRVLLSLLLLPAFMAVPAWAATTSIKQVILALNQSTPDHPADLANKDLSELDLSGMDFKHADMHGCNFYGTDLSGSDMSGVNLTGARLDRAVIIHTNFSYADLSFVSMVLPAAFTKLEPDPAEAPNFSHANLSGAKVLAKLAGSDMSYAKMIKAHLNFAFYLGVANGHTDLTGAKMTGADLEGADIIDTHMAMADLSNANLKNADLTRSDLSSADLSGANLDNTQMLDTHLDGAKIKTAKGLSLARNMP